MFLWRVIAENIDEEGLTINIYDRINNYCIDIHFTADSPTVDCNVVLYTLREDFKVRTIMYDNLPKEFYSVTRDCIEDWNPEKLTDILFDSFVYAIFLEHSSKVAKTKENLKDLGYVFH